VYFNQRFGVSAIAMQKLGVFNAKIGVDNRMFVDPKLLNLGKDEFDGAHEELVTYFSGIVQLVKLIKSKTPVDQAWTAAWNRMRFKETANTAMGFSKEGTDGNGIGEVLAKRIVQRACEILPNIDFAPDLFELIGVFAERIGCDRLSDMIVSILKARFLLYTERITKELGVQHTVEASYKSSKYICPRFKTDDKPIILIPRYLLKPLPIAASIEDALDIADLNALAREEVNRIYAEAHKRRRSPKPYLRSLVLGNASVSRGIVSGYKNAKAVPYDYDNDPNQIDTLAPIAHEIAGTLPPKPSGLTQIERVEGCVRDALAHLQKSIEENRLSDVLYDDAGKPRKEVVSQRLIYAIAKIFANIYDVDVSREGNAGPGAVDFRFTVGHEARLLVEVKLSTHARLREGYYEQLPAYASAENVKRLILLVIRVSADDTHLTSLIKSIDKKALRIQLVVIDAVPKPSASKRPHNNTT
jgi:hypothetical protein